MANILFIKPNEKKTRYLLGVDDGLDTVTYSISRATYLSLGEPMRGAMIEESTLVDIRYEDEVYRAVRKACNCLSYSDRSNFALRGKLMESGFSPDAIDEAIKRCISLGYLDEERQLERAVEKEANYSLRGKYHIKRKLAGKGYSLSAIDRAIRSLVERGDVDFESNFDRLAEKRGAITEEERNALKHKFGYKI